MPVIHQNSPLFLTKVQWYWNKCLLVTRNARFCLYWLNPYWPGEFCLNKCNIIFVHVYYRPNCVEVLLVPQPNVSYRVMGRIRAGDSLRIAAPLSFVLSTSQRQFFFHVFPRTWVTATDGHFLLWKSLHPSVPVMHLKTSAHARLATNNRSAPRICWRHKF